MLANPVVVPAHADPAIWCIAVLAIAAETRTVRTMLGRRGEDIRGLDGPIAALNLATWTLFLWAVDAIDLHTHLPVTWAIAVLEVLVILGEAALLRSLASGQLFHPPLRNPLRWRTALWLSFAGNGASIAVSLAIPLAVVGLLRCIP